METGNRGGIGTYCLFPCGPRFLAVSADAVEAFLDDARLVRLPLCPRPVGGLCTYRGGLLPVVQPAEPPEGGDSDLGGRRSKVLSLRTGRGLLGLLIGRGEIAIVEEGLTGGEHRCAVVENGVAPLPGGLVAAGSIERDGESYPLLDPDRTWAAVREMIGRGYDAARGIGSVWIGDRAIGDGPGSSAEGGSR